MEEAYLSYYDTIVCHSQQKGQKMAGYEKVELS